MKISFDQLNADLDALVAEKGPDYVYPKAEGDCLYFEGRIAIGEDEDGYPTYDDASGVPSCIVGHVAAQDEHTKASQLPLWADTKAAQLANRVQNLQDNGATWAAAVEQARDELARGLLSEDGELRRAPRFGQL
jgi:hypothetical protein